MKTCLRLMLILFLGILLAVGAEKKGISVKSEMENHTVPCRCDCEPDKDKHCEICNACLKKLTKKFPSPTEDALTDIEQQSCRNQHPGGEKLARGKRTLPCASPLLRPEQNKPDPRLQPDQGILKILLHPVDTMNVSVRYTILKTMPNIPSNLANFLKDMEPGFVQYIINNHEDLAPLLLAMDKSSIQYVSLHVPEFGLRVSELDTVSAQLVFSQILDHHLVLIRDLKYTTEETLKNNPTDRMDPSVHYAILRYMPNLPIELAYVLYNMDPGFVEYIINGHQNLPHLLMAMDAVTLRYLLLHVSNFGARVSAFEDAAVQNIFGKMPSPCVYLSTLDRNIIETIIAKAPFLSVCRPQLEVDLSQIGRFEPKLPAIMELADPKKLNAMRTLHPDFTKKLSKMVEKYRAFFNMDVGKTTAKDVKQILVFKSKTEPFFAQLARLF
ncbi:hypothetical protein Aperf_G00000000834 [Anoplocephala perfoliata]